MICSICGQETGDVTAHPCSGPPTEYPKNLTDAWAELGGVRLGKLEAEAETRIRQIVRDEMDKRFGWSPGENEFFGEER